ncbi:MAG: hypothetical protein MUE61_08385 [Vicinamibacterales bacterium]|jgi:hypothetical protein|nr:hypothetical protein [Vicinamibacterales bacterium]MCU0477182.1 hypothetical protein [Chloroflexota bacterium]MCU0562329.1 hypothetical protein [Desulfobacterales bacterium]
MAFTAADHVTQREEGPWRDCTFASMLEVIRLGLPNGRAIPATEAEKERFRAAAGFPDDHTGATIEDTLPAAERLYALEPEHYLLTRDWTVLAAALEDPTKVCVVTGWMGSVPASERITSFTGAHAVAKHGVRVRCDPLGPKDGRYVGNTWALSTWRAFTSGLPGWQALVMEEKGAGMPLAMSGVKVTSNKLAVALRNTDLLDKPSGTKVISIRAGVKLPYLGSDSGHRMVIARTGAPYPDAVPRDTGLFAVNADIRIEDVPAPPLGDVKQKVTLAINDKVEFTKEV